MLVSLLSHQELKSRVENIEVCEREISFGIEVSLWIQNHLVGLGYSTNGDGLLGQLDRSFRGQFGIKLVPAKIARPLESPSSLILVGSPFQQQVWKELMNIPQGKTATYQEIANAIGNPHAARAVGSAIGRNPISLHVPCHRVIRTDGDLGGYRWGLDVKKKLLENEQTRLAA